MKRTSLLILVLFSAVLATASPAEAQWKIRDYPHIYNQDRLQRETKQLRNRTSALLVAIMTAYDTVGSIIGRDMNPVIDDLRAEMYGAGGLTMGDVYLDWRLENLYGEWDDGGTIRQSVEDDLERMDKVVQTAQGALRAAREHGRAMVETEIRLAIESFRMEASNLSETEAQQIAASIRVLEAQELQLARHAVLLEITLEATRLADLVQRTQGAASRRERAANNAVLILDALPVPAPPAGIYDAD